MTKNRWTEIEISIIKDNYHKGLLFIMKLLPRHTKQSIMKKAKRLRLSVDRDILYYDMEVIRDVVKNSFSLAEVFRKLNKSKSGDSYKILKKLITRNNINISHFDPWKNNRNNNQVEKPISYWLNIGTNISSSHLKPKLYKYGLKERKCELCGQNEEWNGKIMSLILDHINGINNDNRLENLRIVCPNCNSTLDTHCRGGKILEKQNLIKEEKNKIIFTKKEVSSQRKQRKVQRPSYDQLLEEVKENGYTKTGKIYNVSDNTIRKWIKMYEKYGPNF